MRYLWDNLDQITGLLRNHQTKVLMLDFDGTLTPIVKLPQHAILSSQTKQLLQNLSKKPGLYLAIISGRELAVLKDRVALPNIIYGGIHGFEGDIQGQEYLFPIPKEYTETLVNIHKKLQEIVPKFNGAIIQDKKTTLALHYRLVEKPQIKPLKLLFDEILKDYKNNKLVSVIAGKKIWEIRPNVDWNKGSFAKLVIEEISKITNSTPLTLYIGDDQTDEDAFESLQDQITIRVGKHNKSKAKYYLKNPWEVIKFLRLLNTML